MQSRERGYSLVEMLVVLAIIVIMSAVALPSIGQYIRNYRINGAANKIAAQIQTARSKAIMKNVNLGTVFAVTNTRTSGWAIEDDLQPTTTPNWNDFASENWPVLIADKVQSPGFTAVEGTVEFVDPSTCPGSGAAAPNSWGIRFNRMGASCTLTAKCAAMVTEQAPGSAPGYTNYIHFSTTTGTATMCIEDTVKRLRRIITISTGGRVRIL